MGNAVVIDWTTELLATTFTSSFEDCSHRKITGNVISFWVVGGYGSVRVQCHIRMHLAVFYHTM